MTSPYIAGQTNNLSHIRSMTSTTDMETSRHH